MLGWLRVETEGRVVAEKEIKPGDDFTRLDLLLVDFRQFPTQRLCVLVRRFSPTCLEFDRSTHGGKLHASRFDE